MKKELWQNVLSNGELSDVPRVAHSPLARGMSVAAAHVWIWREKNGARQVLLQKRAADKHSWPGFYDISAAGHIDFLERPISAAIRETKEELNLDVTQDQLKYIGTYRVKEHTWEQYRFVDEYQWIYILKLDKDIDFFFNDGEVSEAAWFNLERLKSDVSQRIFNINVVRHDKEYFGIVFKALEDA
jgi:isopentenyl-diphosphate Delta-isomerase